MIPKSNPTYLQIEEQMIVFFRQNNFKYGEKLPTEHQLMKKYSVSRTTIRKTLEVLKNKGLIDRNQGSGTFYTGRPAASTQEKKGKTLGLVNYFLMDYIYTEILRGIDEEATANGYSLIVANSYTNDEKQYEAIQRLVEQKVDGLILEPTSNLQIVQDHPILELLESSGIPVVTTHWGISSKSLSTVTLDDVYGGRLAARYLLNKGHRNVGYIYKKDIQPGFDRYTGFSEELKSHGCPLNDNYCYHFTARDEEENGLQGYILTKKMFEQNSTPPSAIFYFNDNLAIQGYKALAELNLKVPEDVSILGFDDHSNAAIVSPSLTTFAHPKYDLGRWAARILIDEIENQSRALPMKLLFEPKVVERGSVASLLKI